MLSSITWQEYITAITILVGGYYVISFSLLYHREIIHRCKSRFVSTARTVEKFTLDHTIMGGVNEDHSSSSIRSNTIAPEDIAIASATNEPETIDIKDTDQRDDLIMGSIADLLEEVKHLLQRIKDDGMGIEETTALFNALLIRYPQLAATAYKDAITLYIGSAAKNHLPFELQHKQVSDWWTNR